MRKNLLTVIALIFCSLGLAAQQAERGFNEMQAGSVLVKLKPAFAHLNAEGAGMRSSQWKGLVPGLDVYRASAFSTIADQKKISSSKRVGRGSGHDIRLYHQLYFDPSIPVAEAIERLQKSGIVELAEPAYMAKSNLIPNDPNLSEQYYIPLVKAPEAWDITTGKNSIVIAILDSGVDISHPDLAANIFVNTADPIDGIDNDGDGFVDNYYGWDFAGKDYQNIEPDNDPSTKLESNGHGTMVAGCASAVTNNGIGIAGVGYNAKLMVLKHSADNDFRNEGSGFLINLLQGVVYAATHGADIINASYGSTYFSQLAQDIYEFAALDFGVVIIAAAGNDNSAEPHFPSDYNYVLSVSATNKSDGKATFSNFGFQLDMAAPGANIYTTQVEGKYGIASGTSFAAPIVAGAAALVKTVYPEFNGAQIAEVLRVTADERFTAKLTSSFKNKMGRGRLDVARALTVKSPSIRMDNSVVEGPGGDVAKAGDEAIIYGDFVNFLWPVSGATVTLSSTNSQVTVLEGTVPLGDIGMMQGKSSKSTPFRIRVSSQVPANTEVFLRLDYAAGDYTDYQYIKVLVNPSYYNINENLVATTLPGNGRVGYQGTSQKQGLGFVYNNVNMLYEMGVMMAAVNKDNKVVSSVRTTASGFDDDFNVVNEIVKDNPGTVSDVDVYGTFDDSKAGSGNRLNVAVDYRGFVWREVPFEKMVVVEYEVTNTGTSVLEGFYLGLYADWDINQDDFKDKADWDGATQTGYVYTPNPTERWVGGIQVLTGTPNYWAIDNDQDIAGNPFGVYDGFTDPEKFESLSSGIGRKKAGETGEGNDVSHTVSAGPYTIPAGESVRIAFALHGASSIEEMLAAAAQTKLLYESLEGVERPVATGGTTPTGLAEEIPNLKVYPNPTEGMVNIVLPEPGKAPIQLRILDATGKQLLQQVYPAGQPSIQLSMPQNAGFYLLEIGQGDKRSIRRIVVQK